MTIRGVDFSKLSLKPEGFVDDPVAQ